jgi:hypothetical protein
MKKFLTKTILKLKLSFCTNLLFPITIIKIEKLMLEKVLRRLLDLNAPMRYAQIWMH